MKSVALNSFNTPFVVETDIEMPPLQENQLLVKMTFSGLCTAN